MRRQDIEVRSDQIRPSIAASGVKATAGVLSRTPPDTRGAECPDRFSRLAAVPSDARLDSSYESLWCRGLIASLTRFGRRRAGWDHDAIFHAAEPFDATAEWTFPEIRSADEAELSLSAFEYELTWCPDACLEQPSLESAPDLELDLWRDAETNEWGHVPSEVAGPLFFADSYPGLGLNTTFSKGVLQGRDLRGIPVSLGFHMILLSLFLVGYAPMTEGTGIAPGGAISVRLVDAAADTPQEEQAASADSPASSAAVAGKAAEPDAFRGKQPPPEAVQLLERSEQPTREREADREKRTETTEAKQEREKQVRERSDAARTGANEVDSLPSIPSRASLERRSTKAETKEGDRFKGRVLQAIHEAAFFPRRALGRRHHGKVIVSFTIRADGSLADLAVMTESGSGLLDDAALKIVQKASKQFPSIPEGMMTRSITYEVPIIFKQIRAGNTP